VQSRSEYTNQFRVFLLGLKNGFDKNCSICSISSLSGFKRLLSGQFPSPQLPIPDSLTIGIKTSGQAVLPHPSFSFRRRRSSSSRTGDLGSFKTAPIQSRSDQEQEKDMCRPDGTLKSVIFLSPAIKMAGYGIGRPDGTFWMSIAGHWAQTPAALPDSVTIGIEISGQALLPHPSPLHMERELEQW